MSEYEILFGCEKSPEYLVKSIDLMFHILNVVEQKFESGEWTRESLANMMGMDGYEFEMFLKTHNKTITDLIRLQMLLGLDIINLPE